MKNGACYIRVSTDKQEELSPDAQRRLLLDYAKKNDIIISSDYIYTEAISGRQASKRPEFQRMVAAAKSENHPIDVILVWKYSRFARNQEESIVYKSLLKKQCAVDVISVSEPLIDGPFGSLIERIIEWMDEYYSIRLSGEVMRGMTEKARRGGYQATTPLGYRYNGSHQTPTVIEEEAEIIRYIFRQYAGGADRTTIARRLNEMGCRTKRGSLFEKRTIEYILKNPFYIGKVRWNRAPHSAYHDNPDDEIIIADGQHTPIIEQELYDRAGARLKTEFIPSKARSVSTCKHWLSGLLKCSVCGSSLSYSRPAGGFQCWKYMKGFHKESCYISEKRISREIISGVKELLDGNKEFSYEYRPPVQPSAINRISTLEEDLRRIASREQRIKLAYENGIDTLEEYRGNKQRLNDERHRLEAQIDAEKEKESASAAPSKDEVLKRIQNVYDMISDDSIDYVTKGTIMREIFSEIIYDRGSDSLTFRIVVS